MYYLCHTKEERAQNKRVLSSFLAKKLRYKGCFTSDVEKNTSEINFFLGFSVNFLGQVVAVIADKERWKVKIHLFFRVAHLTLGGGNYSGGCKAMYHTLIKGLWLSDIGRMAEVRKVPHLACKV